MLIISFKFDLAFLKLILPILKSFSILLIFLEKRILINIIYDYIPFKCDELNEVKGHTKRLIY